MSRGGVQWELGSPYSHGGVVTWKENSGKLDRKTRPGKFESFEGRRKKIIKSSKLESFLKLNEGKDKKD